MILNELRVADHGPPSAIARNRKFESISLQRRVKCEPDSLAFARIGSDRVPRGSRFDLADMYGGMGEPMSTPTAAWFVSDSALEGDGFELSVPRERGHRFELSLLFMSLKPSAF